MGRIDGYHAVQPDPAYSGGLDHRGGVPCAARPSTAFRHYEGGCECFFGGPPPEYPPALLGPRRDVDAPGELLAG